MKASIGRICYHIAAVTSAILKGVKSFWKELDQIDSLIVSSLIKILAFILAIFPILWIVVIFIVSKVIAESLLNKEDMPDTSDFIF